jgi:hypothetical protein
LGVVLGVVAVILVLAGLLAAGVISPLDIYSGVTVGVAVFAIGTIVVVCVVDLFLWVTYDKRGD